jgi:hypothetical protein
MKVAKEKLNVALEEIISNIEIKKKEIKKTQKSLNDNTKFKYIKTNLFRPALGG